MKTKHERAVLPGESVDFPDFCLGRPTAARRQLTAVGRAWASHYEGSHEFPEFEVLPVRAGSLVFMNASADLNENRTGARLYLVFALLDAIQKARGWQDAEPVRDAFERALRRLPSGALAFGLDARAPDPLRKLRLRIDGLAASWADFERFEYVDGTVEPISLAGVVERRFQGLLKMWRPEGGSDLRRDLPAALAAAENATATARTERAVGFLRDVVSTNARIRNKEKLPDSQFLNDELAALAPDEREAIEAGVDVPVWNRSRARVGQARSVPPATLAPVSEAGVLLGRATRRPQKVGLMPEPYIAKEIRESIRAGNLERLESLFAEDTKRLSMTTTFGTWLHVACSFGQLEVVKYLVDHGVDVNARGGIEGGAPTDAAASEGHVDNRDVSAPVRAPWCSTTAARMVASPRRPSGRNGSYQRQKRDLFALSPRELMYTIGRAAETVCPIPRNTAACSREGLVSSAVA